MNPANDDTVTSLQEHVHRTRFIEVMAQNLREAGFAFTTTQLHRFADFLLAQGWRLRGYRGRRGA
jgi:hypothetical protein